MSNPELQKRLLQIEKDPTVAYERYCKKYNVIPDNEEREKWTTGWTQLAEEAKKEPVEAQYREIVSPKGRLGRLPPVIYPPESETVPINQCLLDVGYSLSSLPLHSFGGKFPECGDTRELRRMSLELVTDYIVIYAKQVRDDIPAKYEALNLAINAFEEIPNYGLNWDATAGGYPCIDALKEQLINTRNVIDRMDMPVEYAEHMLLQRFDYAGTKVSEYYNDRSTQRTADGSHRDDMFTPTELKTNDEPKKIMEQVHENINSFRETMQQTKDIEPVARHTGERQHVMSDDWEEQKQQAQSPFNNGFFQEIKERMQGAYEVLTGRSAAVDWKLVEKMADSHYIVQSDIVEAHCQRNFDDALAALPEESRTSEMEKQVFDSFIKKFSEMQRAGMIREANALYYKAQQVNLRAQQPSAPGPEQDRDLEPDL